jgi:hypothetical protein
MSSARAAAGAPAAEARHDDRPLSRPARAAPGAAAAEARRDDDRPISAQPAAAAAAAAAGPEPPRDDDRPASTQAGDAAAAAAAAVRGPRRDDDWPVSAQAGDGAAAAEERRGDDRPSARPASAGASAGVSDAGGAAIGVRLSGMSDSQICGAAIDDFDRASGWKLPDSMLDPQGRILIDGPSFEMLGSSSSRLLLALFLMVIDLARKMAAEDAPERLWALAAEAVDRIRTPSDLDALEAPPSFISVPNLLDAAARFPWLVQGSTFTIELAERAATAVAARASLIAEGAARRLSEAVADIECLFAITCSIGSGSMMLLHARLFAVAPHLFPRLKFARVAMLGGVPALPGLLRAYPRLIVRCGGFDGMAGDPKLNHALAAMISSVSPEPRKGDACEILRAVCGGPERFQLLPDPVSLALLAPRAPFQSAMNGAAGAISPTHAFDIVFGGQPEKLLSRQFMLALMQYPRRVPIKL